jgi:hypothetical protein
MLCWVGIVGHTKIIFHNQFFFVVGVFSIMATNKINVMVSKEHFEGFLRYYVKMNLGEFIEQWVTPELYHKLFE